MKNAKICAKSTYIICNDMMYNTYRGDCRERSDCLSTNSVLNNENPFGSADYAKNRNRILSTGINIWGI